jgi:hypothetical protein
MDVLCIVDILRRPVFSRTPRQIQERSVFTIPTQESCYSQLPKDEPWMNFWQKVELTDGLAFVVSTVL